ncbi:hypothetical protein FisN_2Lh376 [Fistulifera solaris]|uniref:DUF3730 domain-containing protein n=1 Tax=Fistulifera solaris TaxID=1519565 RepID=A0A1Z5JQ45_FISSO|nr:hypothetical protein FisN_2Lh376 [Fistulifera solaris]|eukprot:GAX15888.1 hypothetical protein FisN_2Lh376 [Fistulifera solaris]
MPLSSHTNDAKKKEQRIQSLLQQCQRQFTQPEQQQQMPHAVAASLGRSLAQACCEFITSSNDDLPEATILETLSRSDLHPSIAYAFFENMDTKESLPVLTTGMTVLEESACFSACARGYARNIVHHLPADQETALVILETYRRLELPASRAVLVCEMMPLVRENAIRMPALLSPLLAVTFLSQSEHTFEEQSMLLHQLWRTLWSVWANESLIHKIKLLEWLIRVLRVILMAKDNHRQVTLMQSCFIETVLLAQAAIAPDDDIDYDGIGEKDTLALVQWSDVLLCEIVPLLRDKTRQSRERSNWCPFTWKPVYDALVDWLTLLKDSPGNSSVPLDPLGILQWCTVLHTTHLVEERKSLLDLFVHWTVPRLNTSLPMVRSLLEGVSCIWLHDSACHSSALQLKQEILAIPVDASTEVLTDSSCIGTRLLEGDRSLLGKFVLSASLTGVTNLSSEMQIALLLVASSQLSVLSEQRNWYRFLERLIQAYPHLGITFLPVHLQLVQNAAQACDGLQLLHLLEFMAGPLVMDSHCAQQIWSFFGSQWVQDGGSMELRITVLRLYPQIVRTNKKMYRRVIDSLGLFIYDKDPEIRLAVAASICDLAKDDCIRDVADVIGWVQHLLTEDVKSPVFDLLRHSAIMSLHYLTLNRELEFPLVIKVLNKKLCNITDRDKLIGLPMPILEALCLLLGDGETDDDESEGGVNGNVGIQVRQSIDTLLYLGGVLVKKPMEMRMSGVETCLFHIFESLNRYSLKTLEVDEDDVKRNAEVIDETEENFQNTGANRYLQLQELVLEGMEFQPLEKRDSHTAHPVTELASKIMSFEEDVLGATFWQKRSSPRRGGRAFRDKLSRERKLRDALPSFSLLTSLRATQRSNEYAIALLWASDGTQLTILRDNADACIENADPLILAFAVKGFLRISGLCLRLATETPSSLLNEIRDWNEVFVSPDAMFVSLTSFAVSLSEKGPSDEGLRSEIEAVADDTLASFQANEFQNESIGKICLGLCGAVYIHLGEFRKAVELLDLLEHSVRGYSGQQDFGAYFGVSIIAQTVEVVSKSECPSLSIDEMATLTSKAAAFIVEELLSCFEDGGNVTTSLLACIKAGHATPDLMVSLERLGSNSLSLLGVKRTIARSLFISSSIGLPSLGVFDGNLLAALFRLLNSFEWMSGKGIALGSILWQCDKYQLIDNAELDLMYNEYASILQRRIDESHVKSDALGEIFYIVNGNPRALITPKYIDNRIVGNAELFDDQGRATALIACVLSICSMPALGLTSFSDIPRIHTKNMEADVQNVTETVLAASNVGDGSIYSSMGVILLGILASIKQEIFGEETLSKINLTSKPFDKDFTDQRAEDITISSRPQLGTLSEGVFTLLERSYSITHDSTRLSFSLTALGSISLPGEFAKGIIPKILQDGRWSGEAGVSLLRSQLHGRRSVLQDGREFVDLAIHIFASSPDRWHHIIVDESARNLYIKEVDKILPRLSITALGSSTRNIWRLCIHPGTGSQAMAILFLDSMGRLLAESGLSSKGKEILSDFLCSECYESLIAEPYSDGSIASDGCIALSSHFVRCVQSIPLATIEGSKILSLSVRDTKSSLAQESFRAFVFLQLVSVDDRFSASKKQALVKHYQCWLIQSLACLKSFHFVEIGCLRLLHQMFATLTSLHSAESKRETLFCILDTMLLASVWTVSASLELIGMLLSTWRHDLEDCSDIVGVLLKLSSQQMEILTSLEQEILFKGVVTEFPRNLSFFVTSENCAQFSNIIQRLHLRCDGTLPGTISQQTLFALFFCQSVLWKNSSFFLEATKYMVV